MNGVFYNRIIPEPDGLNREIKMKDHSFSKSLVSMKNEIKSGKKKGDEKKTTKPRIAFQTRTKVDILDDGYRWRKYGQKAVKNQKFPRRRSKCSVDETKARHVAMRGSVYGTLSFGRWKNVIQTGHQMEPETEDDMEISEELIFSSKLVI
ncbi:putative WRKY transcription factor 75 [Abeliophyllum distichum]|uniref:WRKY transcription factor 75 n=1 Tax=Abeliophyllum distichum TaxID=126358 RepID=A0ABD1VQT0_9LAMI